VDRIVIEGVRPYDGRYDLDLGVDLTTREWGWIKRLAGYLPLGLTDDAFGDPEFACVLAAIAMRRAGRIQASEVPRVFERLADAPFGSTIRIESDDEQDESQPDPPASSSSNGVTSGTGSPTNSGTPATPPKPTGTPASATSRSGPVMSAT
jgi:hypothetical protein